MGQHQQGIGAEAGRQAAEFDGEVHCFFFVLATRLCWPIRGGWWWGLFIGAAATSPASLTRGAPVQHGASLARTKGSCHS